MTQSGRHRLVDWKNAAICAEYSRRGLIDVWTKKNHPSRWTNPHGINYPAYRTPARMITRLNVQTMGNGRLDLIFGT